MKLGFGNLPTGVSAGSTNETVVSITDDDLPSVEVSFEQAAYTVAEGSSINITVTLDQDPERTVTIPLTVTNQGGATSTDHSLVPENITFNAGQTSRTFSFQADQDSDNDDGESVKLGFGSLPAGVSAGPTAETTVSIADDDAAPTEQSNSFLVSFGASEYSASEGGPNAAVTVQLNRAAEGEITVPITVAGMNGATRDDWTGVPPMLSFSIGQRSKTFTVMAYDDDIEDDGEAVELGFGSLPDGVTSTSPSTATVHLMNTETPGTETSEPAQCGDNQANKIILLDATGEITAPGQSAFWEVELDPFKSYLFEAIGADDGRDLAKEDTYDGDLTLEDPDIIATWKWQEGRMEWMQVAVASWIPHDNGYGRNSISGTMANSPGLYRIEVAAGGDGTGIGTYQVKVRLNNYCIMVYGEPLYQYFGGPEGYGPNDIPADTSTRFRINPGNPASSAGNFLGDNWDSAPDEDWFGAELTLGYEYTVELWSRPDYPEEHRAKKLKILGIYDSAGTEMADTASSNSGKRVSVVFRPESTGLYYIAAGSNGIQTTGLYRISATEKETPGRAGRGEPVPQDQQGEAGGNNAEENNPGADDESEKRDQEADEPNSPASGQPVITGTAQAGLPLTADTSAISDDDGLSDVEFNYQWVADDTEIQGATGSTYELSDSDVGKTIKVRVSFTDDADNEESLTSSATVAVAARPNSPATGLPTISGAAEVGETLTASTSGIGDADGLDNATFSYQWIADNSDIAGATDSTYPLVSGDEGKSVKVRVSFTDDRGNEETLTSGATAAVAGLPSEPLTVSLENTPTGHNGTDAFTFELRFSEEVKLSYKTLRDHSFTVTGGTVTRARRLDKPSNIRWEIHVVPDSSATVTVVLPVTTDCDDPGAICTKEDRRPLSNLLELTVSGPGG